MEDYEEFLPKATEKKKIPYDEVPIYRQRNRTQNSNVSKEKSNVLNVVVSLLVVACIVFSALFVVAFNRIGNNTKYNLMGTYPPSKNDNTSTDVDDIVIKDTATGLAIRSVVSVQAFVDSSSTSYNAGAGVIVDDLNGYVTIITNYHVCYISNKASISSNIYVLLCDYVNPEENIEVYKANRIKVEFVGGSYNNDIAILRFSRGTTEDPTSAGILYKSGSARPATIGDSNMLNFGDSVIAIGNPGGSGINVSIGVVSKPYTLINVDVKSNNTSQTLRCIQFDASINGGNSGGGLFNEDGEWVGIVNAKQTKDNSGTVIEGTSYAIPSNIAIGVAWNIIKNDGVLKLCRIGISLRTESYTITDSNSYSYLKYKWNVYVEDFSTESTIGRDAGIEIGDLIKKVEYKFKGENIVVDIDSPYELQEQLFFIEPEAKMKITVERNGEGNIVETKELQITFGGSVVIY